MQIHWRFTSEGVTGSHLHFKRWMPSVMWPMCWRRTKPEAERPSRDYCNSGEMTHCWLGGGGLTGGGQKWWYSHYRTCAMLPRYHLYFTESIYTPAAGKVRLPAFSCQPSLGIVSSNGSHLFLSGVVQTQWWVDAGLWRSGSLDLVQDTLKHRPSLLAPCRVGWGLVTAPQLSPLILLLFLSPHRC